MRHHQPSEQTVQMSTLTWYHGTAAPLQKNFNCLGCHKDTPLKFVRDTFQTFVSSVAIKRFVHGPEGVHKYHRER